MRIHGLQRLTLLDYPGKLACTVFLGGCNFRCPFCHNGSLVQQAGEGIMGSDELLAFLESRRGRLQGVCISGGEPTIHPDLPELIGRIKELGYSVKLDTNGTNPEKLYSLIADGLVDYVAMDIKNCPDKYGITAGLSEDSHMLSAVKDSADLLMQGRVDFEFRTTLVKELHTAEDLLAIGEWLRGDERYFLQTYRDEGDLLVGGFTAFSREETEELLKILKENLPNAEIRG
ncbi:MAG: anaerobic ribonucleoside-triphosphate reductase activating protein [Clostridia bacterium]|nr:anaerobic ribonucleoside-triphosphate reductase activating protein [Clostridia bacterium]